jgi:NAD(P)-dependent dehydrogenase (short-subunit alcohol dehydrogenase family)
MKLNQRVAIVTGAARGIGSAVARRFAAEGARVVVADIDRDRAARTAATMPGAVVAEVDVTDPLSAARMVQTAVDAFGRIDILVNNAGVGLNRPFLETTPGEWERTIRVNLNGTFYCSQAAARVMAESGGGSIVNIASISGERGAQNRSAYGASKAGVIQLTKVMALELAARCIRVNAVAPGPVLTEMTSVTHTAEIRATYNTRIPMKRYAKPDEIAAAVLFLASDEASFITGETVNVDGGFVASGLMFDTV